MPQVAICWGLFELDGELHSITSAGRAQRRGTGVSAHQICFNHLANIGAAPIQIMNINRGQIYLPIAARTVDVHLVWNDDVCQPRWQCLLADFHIGGIGTAGRTDEPGIGKAGEQIQRVQACTGALAGHYHIHRLPEVGVGRWRRFFIGATILLDEKFFTPCRCGLHARMVFRSQAPCNIDIVRSGLSPPVGCGWPGWGACQRDGTNQGQGKKQGCGLHGVKVACTVVPDFLLEDHHHIAILDLNIFVCLHPVDLYKSSSYYLDWNDQSSVECGRHGVVALTHHTKS